MFEFRLETYVDKVNKSMPSDMMELFYEKCNNVPGLDGIKMGPSALKSCFLRGEDSSEIDKEKELKNLEAIEPEARMDFQQLNRAIDKCLKFVQDICRQMAIPFFDEENEIESTFLNMGIQVKNKEENSADGISFEKAYNIITDFFESTDMKLSFLDA